MSGTGSLTKSGAGTLILTGANSYAGGTTVSGGTLQGTTTSLQGNIPNNADVTFDQATTGTYAGIMSGTGGLTKSGAGTLTLAAPTATPAARRCRAASCRATTTSLQGNIVNNATVTFDQASDRHLCRHHVGQRQPDQDRRRHADPRRRQQLHRRHDGVGRHAAGRHDASLQGNIVNNANGAPSTRRRTGTYAGDHVGHAARLTKQRHRHADPDRRQQLHRRHDGVGRHPAGHDDEPAGQHPQQRQRDVRPGAHRHLCRRHVGHAAALTKTAPAR